MFFTVIVNKKCNGLKKEDSVGSTMYQLLNVIETHQTRNLNFEGISNSGKRTLYVDFYSENKIQFYKGSMLIIDTSNRIIMDVIARVYLKQYYYYEKIDPDDLFDIEVSLPIKVKWRIIK